MLIVKDEKIFKEQCEKVSENNEERQALLSGKCSKATVNGAGFRAVRSVCRGLTHACSGPAGKNSTSLWERNRPLAEGRWGSCPREAPPGRPGYWALVRPPSSLEAAGTSGLCPYLWPLLSSPTAPHGALITAKHCPLSMSLCGTVPPHPGPHHWGGSGSHVKADAAHAHTCTYTRLCPSDHAEAS